MCNPHEGVKALDVATGGGHVARRLREQGAEVVTADPAPGMQADVVAPPRISRSPTARSTSSSRRIAPHHFADIGEGGRRDGARVEPRRGRRGHAYTSEEVEAAEKLRDPTHVRNYSEEEWRELLESAGLEIERRRARSRRRTTSTTGSRAPDCTGEDAERVRELLAPHTSRTAQTWHDTKLIVKARKSQK